MYFLGGATHFMKDIEIWNSRFSSVVGGKLKNAYSKDDNVLKLYYAIEKHDSIGRHIQMMDSVCNLKSEAARKKVD